jgi:hypothetical protein
MHKAEHQQRGEPERYAAEYIYIAVTALPFGSLARMLNGLEMTDHAARGGPERPVITESRRRSSLQLAGTVCQPVLHCVT